MQRINFIDHARRKQAARRGGGARTVGFEDNGPIQTANPDLLLDLDEALARLAVEDPTSADVSRATAFREWAYARSWLTTALDSSR